MVLWGRGSAPPVLSRTAAVRRFDPAPVRAYVRIPQRPDTEKGWRNAAGADHFSVPSLTFLDESIGLVDWLIRG